MGEPFYGQGSLKRQRGAGQHIQRAILEIQRQQTVERQQAGQQCAQPQHTRRDRGQQRALRSHAEGDKHNKDQEKRKAEAKAAACAECKPQITDQQGNHKNASSLAP